MLTLTKVSRSFAGPSGSVRVLTDFSLEVKAGECVAVMGPSGSGKTTILMIAGGMLQADSGETRVAGVLLSTLSAEERALCRARHIGFVFQQFHLVPYLSVLENVLAAAVGTDADMRHRAQALLTRFGLAPRLHHLPGQLSSGERQRTALARALLHQPGLILADEPTGNLDLESGQVVLDDLAGYAKEGGAVLLATHDLRAAERADRVVRLSAIAK